MNELRTYHPENQVKRGDQAPCTHHGARWSRGSHPDCRAVLIQIVAL